MSLLDKVEKRPRRTLEFTAVWSCFATTARRSMVGVVTDGCETTREEIEEFCNDHTDFLVWVGEPSGVGSWKFSGYVSVYRSYEGEYDAEAIGEWTQALP